MIMIKIKELMEVKGVESLAQVATDTGITYKTIYNLSNNKTTSIKYDILIKLCNYFNCQVGDIIEYIDIF